MKGIADVSRTYGNGVLHVTSRQDIQVHRVLIDDIHPALVDLSKYGLSAKGGGGNTVRNIAACCNAGVCDQEPFDVTPYVMALTEFLLPDPVNYQLPRKYKIAFAGCSKNCSGATLNDLGCFATIRDGVNGFRVYAGGGMGKMTRVGELLEEFVPADEIHYVAEAVKRVFDRNGNRKNKHKARLRFLVEKIGFDKFRELYVEALAEVRAEDIPRIRVGELPGRDSEVQPMATDPADGFDEWRNLTAI